VEELFFDPATCPFFFNGNGIVSFGQGLGC